MGFELSLAVLIVVFCGFSVARSAGMGAFQHHTRAVCAYAASARYDLCGVRWDAVLSAGGEHHRTSGVAVCSWIYLDRRCAFYIVAIRYSPNRLRTTGRSGLLRTGGYLWRCQE